MKWEEFVNCCPYLVYIWTSHLYCLLVELKQKFVEQKCCELLNFQFLSAYLGKGPKEWVHTVSFGCI